MRKTAFTIQHSILISPPNELVSKIFKIKEDIRAKYGNLDGIKPKPHISIASFKCTSNQAEKLNEALQYTLKEHTIDIQLNAISTFDQGNVIYVKVENSESFQKLFDTILKVLYDFGLKKHLRISKSPHITLAKSMDDITFEMLKADYKNYEIKDKWKLEHVKILAFDILKKRHLEKYRITLK